VKSIKLNSKRRSANIRWKKREIAHIILLAMAMASFCALIILWISSHSFD